MMSEAQLPATADVDEHEGNIASEACSQKTRSDSIRSNGSQNNEPAHYPTMPSTEAVAGNNSATAPVVSISTSPSNSADSPTVPMHSQQHESLPQTPENQFENSTTHVHKIEANTMHTNHANTVRDDPISRNHDKVDNINTAMSAPMSVLGANSDRSDFFRGSNNSSSNTHYNTNDQGTPTNNNTTFGKVKSWFGGGEKEETSDTTAHDYREFSSPSGTKNNKRRNETATSSDEYIEGDVELASNTITNSRGSREEEVMEKCSFAYGPDSPQTYKSSHTLPSIDHQYSNEANNDENGNTDDMDDEENQQYFGTNYQNRRINAKAMAHAITSRAKRTWTERRYRRRLRQSQFIPPTADETNDMNGHATISPTSADAPSSFHYELTSEHRYAFAAAHAALNGKLANEQYRNRHANLREDGYDNDLQFDLEQSNNTEEEVRADLTKSSLAIRGGLIRLPVDNVRLVCDEHLQPGILSIETRDMGGSSGGGTKGYEMFGNANRYGNIHGNMMMHHGIGDDGSSTADNKRQQSEKIAEVWERHELAYVLTVDQHIYQRVAQEMADANRVPFGIYYCCHETGGGENHVGIEVAVLILLIIFFLLVAGMIAWPTW